MMKEPAFHLLSAKGDVVYALQEPKDADQEKKVYAQIYKPMQSTAEPVKPAAMGRFVQKENAAQKARPIANR